MKRMILVSILMLLTNCSEAEEPTKPVIVVAQLVCPGGPIQADKVNQMNILVNRLEVIKRAINNINKMKGDNDGYMMAKFIPREIVGGDPRDEYYENMNAELKKWIKDYLTNRLQSVKNELCLMGVTTND